MLKLFATTICAAADPYTAQLALGHQELETTTRYAARPKLQAVNPSVVWTTSETAAPTTTTTTTTPGPQPAPEAACIEPTPRLH